MREALEQGKTLSELEQAQLREHSEALDGEYYEVLRGSSWLESKLIEGGTASVRVGEQLSLAREALQGVDAILSKRHP